MVPKPTRPRRGTGFQPSSANIRNYVYYVHMIALEKIVNLVAFQKPLK